MSPEFFYDLSISVFVGHRQRRTEFVIAGVAAPDIGDLALTQEFCGRGGKQHITAGWADRPTKSRVRDVVWIAG